MAGLTRFYLISGNILFLGLLIGPLALILGSSLILAAWQTRVGLVITTIGSVLVTLYFAYGLTELFSGPVETRPSYTFYTLYMAIGLATLACDAGAIVLYRAVFGATMSH